MKQLIRVFEILLVFVAVFVASAVFAVSGDEPDRVLIEINSHARVNAREYLLKDIASVKGPEMMRQTLENFSMGFSPAIGKVKNESGRRLAARIESLSWLPDTARIVFPDSVFIKRVGQEISRKRLAGLFHDYVRDRSGNQTFEIREFKTRGPDLYPLGQVELSVRSRNNRGVKGRVSLYAHVLVDGVSHGRISMSGYVDIYDRVVCATRSLVRGAILESNDLSLRRINVSKIPDNYLTLTDMAVGMRLKQNLGANGFFRTNMLEKPPLVSTGDNVVLVAIKGNMRIVATGVAEQEGGLGDQIQVNNLTTNRTVSGRISGPKTVDVFF